jgi:hypothetical protein
MQETVMKRRAGKTRLPQCEPFGCACADQIEAQLRIAAGRVNRMQNHPEKVWNYEEESCRFGSSECDGSCFG